MMTGARKPISASAGTQPLAGDEHHHDGADAESAEADQEPADEAPEPRRVGIDEAPRGHEQHQQEDDAAEEERHGDAAPSSLGAIEAAREQQGGAAGALAVIGERRPPARGKGGNRPKQRAKLIGAAGIERAIGATGDTGDFLERAAGDGSPPS